jgi:hypothetical protein
MGEQVPVEPPGRRLRVRGILRGQRLAEPVEHRQGLVAAAAPRHGRHQRPVRALVEGVGGGYDARDVHCLGMLAPVGQHLGVLQEQAKMAFTQGLAWPFAPVLEPVLGQQVAAVQLGRRPVVLRIPGLVGSPACGFECLGVQPRHRAIRQQHDVVAQAAESSGRPGKCPAGDIERLVQVVGGRRPIAVRPQHRHQGFAVQPMAAG